MFLAPKIYQWVRVLIFRLVNTKTQGSSRKFEPYKNISLNLPDQEEPGSNKQEANEDVGQGHPKLPPLLADPLPHHLPPYLLPSCWSPVPRRQQQAWLFEATNWRPILCQRYSHPHSPRWLQGWLRQTFKVELLDVVTSKVLSLLINMSTLLLRQELFTLWCAKAGLQSTFLDFHSVHAKRSQKLLKITITWSMHWVLGIGFLDMHHIVHPVTVTPVTVIGRVG